MGSRYNHHHQEPSHPFRKKTAAEMLNDAVRNGSIETVHQLLEEGTDINSKVNRGWTALHSAVQRNNEEIVRLLFDKGANPHVRRDNGATPFIIAGIKGNLELLELFLDKGSEINEYDLNGYTAFIEAAWYGKEEALRFLYKNEANVNLGRVVSQEKKELGKGGETALMYAARNGHATIVRALVNEMNANVNICDNRDRNAFVHAFFDCEKWPWSKKKEEIALFLLECGADVARKNEYEKTTLILAVERQSQDLVQAILEKDDVDINAKDKQHKTALRVAVLKNNCEIAKILCENGAAVGNNLELATTYYNDEMVDLLQKYGAMPSSCQPRKQCTTSSRHWGYKLQDLYRKSCITIGKLSKFSMEPPFRIQGTSQGGGVYLGFYDGKEVAVKMFHTDAENAKREKACFEKCRNSNHLVKFCGWEERKTCLYLCLALCEKNLEEYFGMAENAAMKSKDILDTIFQAVKELHGFGFGHQDLHPSNVLIDVAGKVFLADFDKSTQLVDDNGEKDFIIQEDLKALERLVVYVAMRGTAHFEDLPTECPIHVDNHTEIEDLRASLSNLDERIPVSEQLGHLLYHPYFWSKQAKYRFLRDVGNESDIKTRGTKHHNDNSDILKTLNREDDPFKDWTEKIHKDVLDCMADPFSDRDKKKKNRAQKNYENCVTDLLKLIRHVGEHFKEKDEQVKDIIKEPADYFLDLFPNLTIYVYRSLYNIQYDKHFPKAQNLSHL